MNKQELLKQTGKTFLLGDEAVVRGALEAGVGVTTGFPGCPAAEIGDTFYAIAHDIGIYNEYSTNEKTAYETAIGASLAGVRSLVSFKHFGLNVASDSVLPSAYIEPEAGLVCVITDDPQGVSSIQSEQDTRYYARMANIPMIEPSTQQEAKDFTKLAFEISEKFRTPIFIRFTTRVAHGSSPVTLEKYSKPKKNIAEFVKDKNKFNTFSPKLVEIHDKILLKLKKVEIFFETSKINRLIDDKKANLGIITSGICLDYAQEALDSLKTKTPILHLGSTYPVPSKKIANFIKNKKEIVILEELEPILENEIIKIARENNISTIVHGKDILPRAGEYTPSIIEEVLAKLLKKKVSINFDQHTEITKTIKPLRRFPVMCPGCPHRASYHSVKAVAKDAIFGGDIGCVMLGFFPPYETQDYMYDMGAVMGITHGINKSEEYFGKKNAKSRKTISFIGDGTFFHAGIPGLINAVYNKSNTLVVILDNRITAMTGHQLNAGMGKNGMGEKIDEVDIEEIVKASGVKHVSVVNPFNLKEFKNKVREYLPLSETAVIIARKECALVSWREKRKKGVKIKKFYIDQEKCQKCGKCLETYACPAMYKEKGNYYIDEDLCNGCGACVQVCPYGAIKIKTD